ncbi:MAG: hypothetical protein LBC76_03780 [Treponema sp.]|jgi:hypothetical protein|nr:hypothetical protein [Treponema sp.]
MKESKIKECAVVIIMLILVCFGYSLFYNNAFSGYEAQGKYIHLSASTVKFVNNWLKEGPLKLNFIMYEYPDSIEFNRTAERNAYISYPPGAIIPPYILAKFLHKSEIQVGFIKQFLKIKFLLDTLLVCLIFYSIFRITLRLTHRNMIVITSIILALSWMCIPVNLYYLRNVYFSDQCIITVVLFFILLEIYNDVFVKRPILKYFYLGFKFVVSLYGVLTDYYFLFVLFISWLVKIIPLIKSKRNFKKIVLVSLVYVLPVLLGIGLFIIQIIQVPNYGSYILRILKFRTYGQIRWSGTGNAYNLFILYISKILEYFWVNIPFGLLLIISLVIFIIIAKIRNKSFLEKYRALFNIITIIYVPPVLQVFVLQNHSAGHEFSILKFALPVIFVIVIIPIIVLDLKRTLDASITIKLNKEDSLKNIKIQILYLIIILSSVLFNSILNIDKHYYQSRIGDSVSYERENLIRSNYNFSDVYFSFTESIYANPPQHLSVSKKLIYKIDSIPVIFKKFPNLSSDARLLLMVNKGNINKTQKILDNEQDAIKTANLLFSSENYDVYQLDKPSVD